METVRYLKKDVNIYRKIIKEAKKQNDLEGYVEAALFLLSNASCPLSELVDLVSKASPRNRTKMEELVRYVPE